MTFAAQIITLYPEMFPGPLGVSLAGKALGEGKWSYDTINPRDFATDKHRSVDDTPAGGGAGMVLRADIMAQAVDFAQERMAEKTTVRPEPVEGQVAADAPSVHASTGSVSSDSPPSAATRQQAAKSRHLPPEGGRLIDAPILAMTPRGTPITQARIRQLSEGPGVTLICGRFEGFDERIFEARPQIEEVSMGDIILSGGEIAAMMLLDACIRLRSGVMGAASSGDDESFETGLLEYPHYTRPAMWEGREIPEILRSGDHAKIDAWRKQRAEDDTRLRRPDLWDRYIAGRADLPLARSEKKKEKRK